MKDPNDTKKTLRKTLPFYGSLLSELFDLPAPIETRATCDDCAMCNKGTMPEAVKASYFTPDMKCCTYQPSLPNFLVGATLADARPELAEGKARLKKHIASRMGVTPQWLGPSAKWELLYEASSGTSFGHSALIKCSYLHEGRCTIWQHREAVCATFYCKFDGGAAASAFWRSLKAWMCHAEEVLAAWAAKKVAPEVVEPVVRRGVITIEDLEDRPPSDETYASWWRGWVGREEDFYVACHEAVRGLTRAQFSAIVDDNARGRMVNAALKETYSRLGRAKLPKRLAVLPQLRTQAVNEGVVVTTPYNPYDSFLLDPELFELLKRFAWDTPVEEMRKKLSDEEGIEIEDALLIHLAVQGVLTAPAPGWQHGQCEAGIAPKLPGGAATGGVASSVVTSGPATATSSEPEE